MVIPSNLIPKPAVAEPPPTVGNCPVELERDGSRFAIMSNGNENQDFVSFSKISEKRACPVEAEHNGKGVAFHDTPVNDCPVEAEPTQSKSGDGVPCAKDIEALENYFAALPLPKVIQLRPSLTITDAQLFLKEHFRILRGKDSSKNARPHFERLQTLKQLSEQSSFDWSNPQPFDFCSVAPKQSVIHQGEYMESDFDWNDLPTLDFRSDADFCPARWASREGIGIDSIVPS